MLKRVWSIAVALAMLLSMVCFLGASAEDDAQANAAVQLNNVGPANITLETPQEQVGLNGSFFVDVYLNDYQGKLGSLGLNLTYDKNLLSVDFDEIKVVTAFGATGEQIDSNVIFENAEGSIKAIWISETGENIVAPSRVHLLSIPFVSKSTETAEGSPAVIQMATMADSLFTYGADYSINVPTAEEFSTAIDPVMIKIVKAPVSLALEADKQTIRKGQKITVDVTLKGFYSQWAILSMVGKFDSNVFEITNVTNTGAFPGEFIWERGAISPLAVCWVNAADVPLKDAQGNVINEAVIMQVELTAKADATLGSDPYPIRFSFVPEGNFCFAADAENPIAADSGIYVPDSNELSVAVLPRPYLSLSADKTVVAQGGKVTVTVHLNEFHDAWAIMSVLADFDKSAFEIADISTDVVNLEGFPGEFIAEKGTNAPLAVSWVNLDDVNAAASNVDLMKVTLTAKTNLVLDENEFPITFSFVPEGNLSMGLYPDGALSEAEGWYTAESEPLVITIADKPSLEIAVDKTELKPGDEVTVDVTVKDLSIPWAMLSFVTNIDKNVFELVEVIDPQVFPGELIYEPGTNTPLAVCWFNGEDLILADPSAKVLSFKLRVKDSVAPEQDTVYPLSISFADEGNVSLTIDPEQALAESYYNKTSNEIDITVQAVEETVAVRIEWQNLPFEYNPGTWNTETHQWDNRGWTCEDDANFLTVYNEGAVDVNIGFAFEGEYEEISGVFRVLNEQEEKVDLTEAILLPKGATAEEIPERNVWLNLIGAPEDISSWGENARKLGTITVTISDVEEVPGE